MDYKISELLQSLLDQYSSVDMAESEFKRMLNEDDELKKAYFDWCEELGYSPKTGYSEYVEEIFESQDSIWDSLHEFGEGDDL
ncbi:MAG: hypothetical protein LKF31_10365 [Muribaculaceae bacterium]|jgi:5'-deoxynucleotidase YfbR-like HD superfamily hydrolase|nr:hypothetical protein [Muribaculaceae bacterium]